MILISCVEKNKKKPDRDKDDEDKEEDLHERVGRIMFEHSNMGKMQFFSNKRSWQKFNKRNRPPPKPEDSVIPRCPSFIMLFLSLSLSLSLPLYPSLSLSLSISFSLSNSSCNRSINTHAHSQVRFSYGLNRQVYRVLRGSATLHSWRAAVMTACLARGRVCVCVCVCV